MIPKLEDKIIDLNQQNQRLSQAKRELTDKLLVYQECFVIAEEKKSSAKILSYSGTFYAYPE